MPGMYRRVSTRPEKGRCFSKLLHLITISRYCVPARQRACMHMHIVMPDNSGELQTRLSFCNSKLILFPRKYARPILLKRDLLFFGSSAQLHARSQGPGESRSETKKSTHLLAALSSKLKVNDRGQTLFRLLMPFGFPSTWEIEQISGKIVASCLTD